MANIQAVFCDLDGTLLNNQHKISDYNQKAIKTLAEQKNIPFYVVTGRGVNGVENNIKGLELKSLTGYFNGAIIKDYSTGKILKNNNILCKDNIELIDIVKRYDFTCMWYHDNDVFCNKDNKLSADYFGVAGLKPHMDDIANYADKPLIKVIMKWHNEDVLDEVKDYITAAEHLDLWGTYSLPNSLEVLNKKANKGEAVAFIAEHLGYDIKHCMAFGDNANDEPMLDKVGYGIVMKNGRRSTVAKYSQQAEDNNENGVGQYLNEYFSLNL